MRAPAWLGLVGLVACKFSPADPSAIDASRGSDAALPRDTVSVSDTVTPLDAGSAGSACFGSAGGLFQICLAAAPTNNLVLQNGAVIDTGSAGCAATPTQADGTEVCVMTAASLQVDVASSVRVIGNRPLVFVVDGLVTIGGPIDASSHRGSDGPAPNYQKCDPSTVGGSQNGGGGGGGGGTFGALGGAGGSGNANTGAVGGGGRPGTTTALTTVRGGCPGAAGGSGANGNNATDGGTPGDGGGGLYILATSTVTIELSGKILANGEGGGGGGKHAGGGGGGGTGGLIGFDAPEVDVFGDLAANGGGGGEGGDNNSGGTRGGAGTDGSDVPPQAPGATGSASAGFGGNGGGGSVDATAGSANQAGGGGGGGAVGVIFMTRGTIGGTGSVSPPARGPGSASNSVLRPSR